MWVAMKMKKKMNKTKIYLGDRHKILVIIALSKLVIGGGGHRFIG